MFFFWNREAPGYLDECIGTTYYFLLSRRSDLVTAIEAIHRPLIKHIQIFEMERPEQSQLREYRFSSKPVSYVYRRKFI